MDEYNFSFYFDVHSISQFLAENRFVTCTVSESQQNSRLGNIFIEKCWNNVKKSVNGKRKNPGQCKDNFGDPSTFKAPKKDVSQIFKDLNIVPDMGSDLQCALCPYKATQKGSLKIHYKLKHLGGADLTAVCSMCQKKCAMKSSLKRHLIQVHKLSSTDADKLLS